MVSGEQDRSAGIVRQGDTIDVKATAHNLEQLEKQHLAGDESCGNQFQRQLQELKSSDHEAYLSTIKQMQSDGASWKVLGDAPNTSVQYSSAGEPESITFSKTTMNSLTDISSQSDTYTLMSAQELSAAERTKYLENMNGDHGEAAAMGPWLDFIFGHEPPTDNQK
jgi:hypothetical protein